MNDLLKGQDHNSVLAVDDDPDILSLIKRELVKGGYTVFGSLNAAQAKKLLTSTEFVAAIVDNKLGVDKDSSDLSHFLEELPSHSQVPLILTGKRINEEVKNNDHLMVFDTIQKPFARGAFFEAVDKIRLWAQQSECGDEPFSQVISGMTERIEEGHERVKGFKEKDEEEAITVSDNGEALEDPTSLLSQLEDVVEDPAYVYESESNEKPIKVSGIEDSKEEVKHIEARDEADEEAIVVSGTDEDEDKTTTLKGERRPGRRIFYGER